MSIPLIGESIDYVRIPTVPEKYREARLSWKNKRLHCWLSPHKRLQEGRIISIKNGKTWVVDWLGSV